MSTKLLCLILSFAGVTIVSAEDKFERYRELTRWWRRELQRHQEAKDPQEKFRPELRRERKFPLPPRPTYLEKQEQENELEIFLKIGRMESGPEQQAKLRKLVTTLNECDEVKAFVIITGIARSCPGHFSGEIGKTASRRIGDHIKWLDKFFDQQSELIVADIKELSTLKKTKAIAKPNEVNILITSISATSTMSDVPVGKIDMSRTKIEVGTGETKQVSRTMVLVPPKEIVDKELRQRWEQNARHRMGLFWCTCDALMLEEFLRGKDTQAYKAMDKHWCDKLRTHNENVERTRKSLGLKPRN